MNLDDSETRSKSTTALIKTILTVDGRGKKAKARALYELLLRQESDGQSVKVLEIIAKEIP